MKGFDGSALIQANSAEPPDRRFRKQRSVESRHDRFRADFELIEPQRHARALTYLRAIINRGSSWIPNPMLEREVPGLFPARAPRVTMLVSPPFARLDTCFH